MTATNVSILDLYTVEEGPFNGSMGQVFKVHHKNWKVDLAMKRSLLEGEELKEQFIEECDTWINLGLHPHIVSCYYVRDIEGTLSVFSEWMDGGNLKDFIGKGGGDLYKGNSQDILERILDIAIQTARGLDYAHKQNGGLIHRDVKPANILLSKDGSVKIGDFGISKTKKVAYTLAYCSPEQTESSHKLTNKTDIWSWAATLLEMFLGGKPEAWTDGSKLSDEWRAYAAKSKITIPQRMLSLFTLCFKQDIRERADFSHIETELLAIYQDITGVTYKYQQPEAARATLDSLNNKALSFWDMEMQHEAVKYWEQIVSKDGTHRDAVYNYTIYLWRNGIINDIEAEKRLKRIFEHRTDIESTYLFAQFYAERGDLKEAQDILEQQEEDGLTNEAGKLLEWLKSQPQASEWAIHDTHVDQMWVNHEKQVVYTIRENGKMKKWTLASGECIAELELMEEVKCGDISRDWNKILGVKENRVYVMDIESLENLLILHYNETVTFSCFSPDSTQILAGTDEGNVFLRDAMTGRDINTWNCGDYIHDMCFSPDGEWIVIGGTDGSEGRVGIFKTATGECIAEINNPEQALFPSVSISPDKKHVLAGYIGYMQLLDISSGVCLRTFPGEMFRYISFLDDGRYAFSWGGGSPILWDTHSGQCMRTSLTGNSLYISGSTYYMHESVSYEEARIKTIQLSPYRCKWSLSRMPATKQQFQDDRFAKQVSQRVSELIEQSDIQGALDVMDEASHIPKFAGSDIFLSLYETIGRYCRITGIRSFYSQIKGDYISQFENFGLVRRFSDDGRYFIIGDTVWDIDSHKMISQLSVSRSTLDIVDVCFIPDATRILILTRKGPFSELLLYDIVSGESHKLISGFKIQSATVSRDGIYVLYLNDMMEMVLINLRYGGKEWSKLIDGNKVKYIQFHPNGVKALTVTEAYDKKTYFTVWDATLAKKLWCETEEDFDFKRVCFTPDTMYIVLIGRNRIQVREVDTGVCLSDIRQDYIPSSCKPALSPDGKYLITYGVGGNKEGKITWLDIKTAKEVAQIKTRGYLALHPNGKYALTEDGYIRFNYEYEFPGWKTDWDESASPILKSFFIRYRDWGENDFENLIKTLQENGLGWLRPECVRQKLIEISSLKQTVYENLKEKNDQTAQSLPIEWIQFVNELVCAEFRRLHDVHVDVLEKMPIMVSRRAFSDFDVAKESVERAFEKGFEMAVVWWETGMKVDYEMKRKIEQAIHDAILGVFDKARQEERIFIRDGSRSATFVFAYSYVRKRFN